MWQLRVGALPVILGVLLFASSALAWNGFEHQHLGGAAYEIACDRVSVEYAASSDLATRQRASVVCRLVPPTPYRYEYATLMSQWAALAADHTESPSQLTSAKLGDVVVDY